MGILDRIKMMFGNAEAVDPVSGDGGPLGLAVGDRVGYYREVYRVTGMRDIAGDGMRVYHYCLRTEDGVNAILVAEAGTEQRLFLERTVKAKVDWNATVINGVGDEPFHLRTKGHRGMESIGDGATGGCRSVDSRIYSDQAGERRLSLENFGNYQEVRIGEEVYEPEIEVARAGEELPSVIAALAAETAGRRQGRGSAIAAAMALEGRHSDDLAPRQADSSRAVSSRNHGHDDEFVEVDPTAYDDESWADDVDVSDTAAAQGSGANEAGFDSEEDEWQAAALSLREAAAAARGQSVA